MATPATQMAAGGINRIYDAIQAVVPAVTLPIVQMSTWDTIDEFCKISTLWRETMAWTLPAGDREVDLNPVDGNTIAVWVIDIRGLLYASVSPPAIIVDSGDVTLTRTGFARVVCAPSRLSTALPSMLIDQWFEGLTDGVKMRLFSQPTKPYSSLQLAEVHGKRYRDAMRRARDAASRYYDGGTSGWRFPYFAHGRRKN